MNILERIKKNIILGIVNCFFKGTRFFEIKRILLNTCEGIVIEKNAKIVTPIHIPSWSSLYIGQGTWIGRDFSLEGNGEVIIGKNCDLGPKVSCITGSHEIGSADRRAGTGFNSHITIGDSSWIGAKTLLLPGISIGNSCVVGAGAVVTKDTNSNTLSAGNPAKLIREFGE